MKLVVRAVRVGTIADFDSDKRPDLGLAVDSQDVEAVKEAFGNRPAVRDFDGFLVRADDGDYDEVYGFTGNVPYRGKAIYKVTRTYSVEPKRKAVSKPKTAKSTKHKSGRKSGSVNSRLGTMR